MRQPRTVTFVYGGIAAALLVVIATLALVLAPPSAPSVAEFAPRVEEQIEDAPDVQSSRFGSGAGACAAGQMCDAAAAANGTAKEATTAAKQTIEKARVRRCVGDPPPQTEDPQSPACVSYFEGDNGGATAPGVTRDEIVLGAPLVEGYEPYYRAIVAFFNSRYEFYNRKITLKTESVPSCTPEIQRATAQRMRDLGAFAAVGICTGYDHRVYVDELARRKIISFDSALAFETTADLERVKPYNWAFRPPVDITQINAAEFYCRSLNGRNAAWANPDLASQPRKLAIVEYPREAGSTDPTPMRDTLRRTCGVEAEVVRWRLSTGPDDTAGTQMALDLRARGVTTVSCICDLAGARNRVYPDMENAGFRPELFIVGIPRHDSDFLWQRDTNRTRLFGLTSGNKTLPTADEPWSRAVREGDPDAQPPTSIGEELSGFYSQARLLASGIQAAGPHLTTASFEVGLFKAGFPNPGSAAPPYWQAGGRLAPGDRTFVDDFALIYWSDLGDSYTGRDPKGTFCYVDRGARWSSGRWPAREHRFFDPSQPCR